MLTAPLSPARTFPSFNLTEEQKQGPAFAKPKPRELTHALSQDQLDFFFNNGYIALPGLFTPAEAKEFQAASDAVYHADRVDPMNVRYDFAKNKKEQKLLWKIDPFFDIHDTFRKAVFDRRILDALASIYGGSEPRLFKDKLICKPPHTHGNPLHQDYNWWQGYPTSLISVTINIDASTEDNGCTRIYPRPISEGFLGDPGTFDNAAKFKASPAFTPENTIKNIAQPGDVLMFHCFTLHSAGENNTDDFRRQMFLTYNADRDGEHYFAHAEHYRDYYIEGHFKDLSPEDKAKLHFL